jgi:putative ABC transport system permease protein
MGIGATAATFSVVDNVLRRPLGYGDADRLVVILHRQQGPVAPANFLDWQRESRAFSAMGAAEYWTPTFNATDGPQKLFALHVSEDVLPLLGVPPALGRFAGRGEEASREVVIGDGFWRRTFASDPSILGKSIALDGSSYVVVGVMPPGFQFAPFWATRAELWAPLGLRARATDREGSSLRVFGRLAPGISLDAARASMTALTAELERQYPGSNRDVTVTPLKEMVVGKVRQPIIMLFVAVALVLLVACANVAHLLLARAASREKEVALRAALGAGRARLIRQFMTESLVLALAGGGVGLCLARWAIEVFTRIGASSLPRVQAIALDSHVLIFGVALSMCTAVIFGLAPALRFSQPNLTTGLQDEARGATTGRRGRRLRQVLIGSEVALAVMLLIGASLVIRSFAALRAVDPGWVPDRLASLVVSVSGSPEAMPGRRSAFYLDVLERLRALPGVQSASAINHVPLVGDEWELSFNVEGRPTPRPGDAPSATYRLVFPGYFNTVGLPILEGRPLNESDREGSPPTIVINQYLARMQWPGDDPIGKRIRIGDSSWRTVVGVAKNAVRGTWTAPPDAEVYLPLLQNEAFLRGGGVHDGDYLSYMIRTSAAPGPVLPDARAAIRTLAPTVAVSDAVVVTDAVRRATAGAEFIVTLLTVFAGVALLLSAVGIYGVMSHAVATQRREIGIRLALGASSGGIMAKIIGEGLLITGIGAAAGTASAVLASGAMSTLLFGVTRFDLPAFLAALGALTATAGVACYLPARRAARVDPQQALR